ncbi:ADP-heptose:LPS heptosyltransferase [Halopolyspora algeriensis]|uniref:ADP-heptose:LPS heptosyltransferase n=1 Tax=Halopolyspora algeriensis TaxID=1500506 RepID=A0A368VWT4_9ACTN|nr:glycosyltransferase family 9 protein [Halopolyspora algeriensis]RCW44617.1 ADP-heptose:LPS heptosyltransferase [Halopolyspora algeriensis]TQM55978.1 ADP-heptose:LPS heptosyltransferase [Halopolyspora algeriensis]
MAVTEQYTVLVLRALGLGDLLTAVPALRGLRRAFPDGRIVLAAPAPLADLLPLIGAVDTLWPTAGLREFGRPDRAPDIAVNLHGSGPESIEALRAADPRRIMTHAHPSFPELDGPQWVDDQHEVRRWCRLLGHYGTEADESRLDLQRPGRGSDRPGAVVVHPGASHRARQWPPECFARVARRLADRGHDVVITGSAQERALAEGIAEGAGLPRTTVLAGGTDLYRLAALVSEASLVVCADTGLAHVATAFATPSVILFGPVSPRHWGPPDKPRHAALWAGSVGDTFADRPDAGLLRLSVEDVLEAAQRVLAHAAELDTAGRGGVR